MNQFSKLLRSHLERRHISIKDLAHFCRMEERSLQRICRGQVLPKTEDSVQKIIYFLNLSPDERDTMLSAWYQCCFGEKEYQQFHQIMDYLTTFNLSAYTLHHEFASPSNMAHQQELTVYDNPADLSDAIINHLNEADVTGVKILYQPEHCMLTDLFFSFADNFHIPITHYLCLNNPYNGPSNIFTILTHSLTLLSKIPDYNVRFYYGNAAAQFDQFSSLPCIIINSSSVLTFSSDLRHGIAYRKAEDWALFSDFITKLDSACYTLFNHVRSFEEQCDFFSKIDGPLTVLAAQPYLPAFMHRINPYENIPKDFPRRDSVCTSLNQFLKAIADNNVSETIQAYFTAAGLTAFVKNGTFSDLPQNFLPPLNRHQRLIVLKELRKAVSEDRYHLLADPFEGMSSTLHLMLCDYHLTLLIRNPNNIIITAIIDEPGILSQFQYFFSHLKDYHMLSKPEAALQIIDALIRSLQAELASE